MRYEAESISLEWYRRVEPLLKAAYAEVGDGEAMAPSEDMYQAMATDLTSFVLTAYTDEGEPVGIAMIPINRSPHSDIYVATNDLIYVKPEYRNCGIGACLFKMAEAEAEERGADRFYWAIPPGSPLDKALARRRQKYQLFEVVYRRDF